jgi:hypothetical protein
VSITAGQVNCLEPDGSVKSIPAKVELERVATIVGPDQEKYEAKPEEKAGVDDMYEFHLDVIPGRYDIYVTPASSSMCGEAPLPPVFIPSKPIEVNTTFRLDVEPARHLTGTITAPMSLTGWSLQVFDMVSGRLISGTQILAHEDTKEPASIDLRYNLTSGVSPILRLKPPGALENAPVASALPSVYWDLAAADLQGQNKVYLKLSDLSVTPRTFEGDVFDADETVVIASVSFQSISLSGDAFKNASFKIETETDGSGHFKVDVPPGTYRITAEPLTPNESQAIAEVVREVPNDPGCFCGQSVMLPTKVMLTGDVRTPSQGALLGGMAVARPSLAPPLSQLDRELGQHKVLPVGSKPVAHGSFELPLDPGEYDLLVQPLPDSGYPWLVRPRLAVQPDSGEPSSSVGAISVAYPVVVTGVVKDPQGNAMGDATINVWLPIADAQGAARTAVQIAETTTDADGRYTLLLPPSISQ